MRLKKLLIISLLFLPLVVSCRKDVKEPEPLAEPVVLVKHIHSQCGNPPQRDSVNLRPLAWEIVGDRFTLSPKGYEDLGFNMTQIWTGVELLQVEIRYYELCLENLTTQTAASSSQPSSSD